MSFSTEWVTVALLLLGVLGFLWRLQGDVRNLDRDIRGLSERVARLEGMVGTLRNAVMDRYNEPAK